MATNSNFRRETFQKLQMNKDGTFSLITDGNNVTVSRPLGLGDKQIEIVVLGTKLYVLDKDVKDIVMELNAQGYDELNIYSHPAINGVTVINFNKRRVLSIEEITNRISDFMKSRNILTVDTNLF